MTWSLWFVTLIMQLNICRGIIKLAEDRLYENILPPIEDAFPARPLQNASSRMDIHVGFQLDQLIEASWKNELAIWNPEDYDGIKSIRVDANLVWLPEIITFTSIPFDGEAEKDEDEKRNSWLSTGSTYLKVEIYYDGTTTYLPQMSFRSSCQFEVADFPYDKQNCRIIFGPWSEDETSMNLIVDGKQVTPNLINNIEWEIVSATQVVKKVPYDCCTNPFSELHVDIVLKRKPMYYMFYLMLPCLFLLITVLAGHLIPVASHERINLGMVVCLTLVFMYVIASVTVLNVGETSAVSIIYTSLVIEVCVSILGTIFVIMINLRPSFCWTWLPRPLEKRYLPKEYWEENLRELNVIATNNQTFKNINSTLKRRKKRIDSHEEQCFEESSDQNSIQGHSSVTVSLAKVQQIRERILEHLLWLNDLQAEKIMNNRVTIRNKRIAILVDKILFWVMLASFFLTFFLVAVLLFI